MTKEQYDELKSKLSKISSISRGISKADCNFTNSIYLHGTFSTEELIEIAGLVQEFSKTVDTGSYYNQELGITINHPYGSDEYWNVYYYHFTKRRYEGLYGSGSWGNYWNSMHPDGPSVEKVEIKLKG